MKLSRDNWFVERYRQETGGMPTNLCGMFWTAILGAAMPAIFVIVPILIVLALLALFCLLVRMVYEAIQHEFLTDLLLFIGGAALVAGVGVAFVIATLHGLGFLGRRLNRTQPGKVIVSYAKASKQGICPLIEVVDEEEA
jgi:hypothetical protein